MLEASGVTGPNAEPAQARFTAASRGFDVDVIKVDNAGLGGCKYLVIVSLPQYKPGHGKCGKCENQLQIEKTAASETYAFDQESAAMAKMQTLEIACKHHDECDTPTATITSTPTPAATATLTYVPALSVTPTIIASATLTPNLWTSGSGIKIYPNPARGRVNFAYAASGSVTVRIDIYRISGEKVAQITEHQNGGMGQTLTAAWEAANVAPGVYLCRLVITGADGRVILDQKKKVALIK
jgi:hypothetical protein